MKRIRSVLAGAALAVTAGLVVSGCAGSTGTAGLEGQSIGPQELADLQDGLINAQSDPADPVDGGTLKYGGYSEPVSLDPADTIAKASTGGTEMLNIYDSLMRYDTDSGTVEPQLASALTHDDAFRTWTLTLRDGVTFSDGTPLDAAAVKASQERYTAADGPDGALWTDSVVDIATPDARTVVYTLDKTWAGFDNMLTGGSGMIVAPAAGAPGDGFTPIGAGPYTLASWRAGTSITLDARQDYWAGPPHLEQVEFIYMPDRQTNVDTFLNNGLDITYMLNPKRVLSALQRGRPGFISRVSGSYMALINSLPGRPGADPRVRQAMLLAVDPGALTGRVYGSPEFGSSALFPSYSRWHTDVAGPSFDPDKARSLLSEAKADGYDGTIHGVSSTGKFGQDLAVTLETQLEAVGFDVDMTVPATTADQIRAVMATQDYDIAWWGLNFRDADPLPKFFSSMHSGGKQVYGTHTSPEMDALIDRFQTATDDAARRETVGEIQRQINQDAPFMIYGAGAEYVGWQQDVHGVLGSSGSMVLLGEAWKD